MTSWELYQRGEEAANFGAYLVKTIADVYGCEPSPPRIDRCVYKNTDCGAWVRFDEEGILVGTIVEGSDAEYAERIDLTGCDEDADLLVTRFRQAIANCETFASENFSS